MPPNTQLKYMFISFVVGFLILPYRWDFNGLFDSSAKGPLI